MSRDVRGNNSDGFCLYICVKIKGKSDIFHFGAIITKLAFGSVIVNIDRGGRRESVFLLYAFVTLWKEIVCNSRQQLVVC